MRKIQVFLGPLCSSAAVGRHEKHPDGLYGRLGPKRHRRADDSTYRMILTARRAVAPRPPRASSLSLIHI